MLSAIVAISQNGVIGSENKMPWHLPEDLKRFKTLTWEKNILMGRKTFESLGKPLPKRNHIVFSRNESYKTDFPNVIITDKLYDTLEKYSKLPEESFIIGGGELYNLAHLYSNKLYVTEIKKDFNGDTYFHIPPEFDLTSCSQEIFDAKNNFSYVYKIYEKRGN